MTQTFGSRLILGAALLTFFSCKTRSLENTALKDLTNSAQQGEALPPDTQARWDAYVQSLPLDRLQEGCAPKQFRPQQKSRGLVVIYHGFTGCPNQFINVAEELQDLGYHVLLPLLPGNGRIAKSIDQATIQKLEAERKKPIAQIVREGGAPQVVFDNFDDIPNETESYVQYALTMTKIAESFPGPRIIVGLSLGGGLAVKTLITGAERKPKGSPNVWERGLLITPFFKAPSILGNTVKVVPNASAGIDVGFGAGCEARQVDIGYRKSNGICDFEIENIKALQSLGAQVGVQKEMSKIKVPVAVIGVANDKTSDNTAIINAFSFTDPAKTRVCFYPDEVNHATIIEADFAPLAESYRSSLPKARDRNATPRFARHWSRAVQDKIVTYIAEGFDTQGGPFTVSTEPSTEKNPKAIRCALTIDYDAVQEQNRKLCREGKGLPDYCADLEFIYPNYCQSPDVQGLPDASRFKQYCLGKFPKK